MTKLQLERKIHIKRPVLVAVIGYIIGIIMGLYFKISIVFFYAIITAIYIILRTIKTKNKKFHFLSPKRYLRYIKLIINKKVIILIMLSSSISNSVVLFQNNSYNSLYKDIKNITGEAIIISNKEEKEYNNTYKIKVIKINENSKYNGTQIYLKINKNNTIKLEYGDKIKFEGEFIEPENQRNYGGFNYKEYLKTIKIYGSVKLKKIEVIEKNKGSIIYSISNKISEKIKNNINKILEKEPAKIVNGIVLGDKKDIEEDIIDDFKVSGISHILAISGMHISYIILIFELVLKKGVGKNRTKIFIIVFLCFYMFITGFSPSIVRASVMGILLLSSSIFHRKNDVLTSMSLSLICSLVYNPFLIESIGVQFSYISTLGILLLQKNTKNIIKNIKFKKMKYRRKIKIGKLKTISKIVDILSVTISTQIAILPITIYHFNIFGVYFLISNLIVSFIIGPILVLSLISIFFSFWSISIAKLITCVLNFLIYSLIIISNFISKMEFSKVYIQTPNILLIILYYFLILLINYLYLLYNSKNINLTQTRIKNIIALIKYKININRKKYMFFIIISFLFFSIFNCIPKNLKVNFVDVGQGDCTFVITPLGKTVLIDGGGSTSNEYDIGKNTLLPYLLDRGYTKLDYIIISHFDQDHVGGILSILEEIKVEKIIISKQIENSENYEKFKEIIKHNNIKVIVVNKRDIINIEKNVYIDILWPNNSELINENALNNNSIVCKIHYNSFSMLFTGDIEECAEKQILEEYKNNLKALNSNILKVAHHGSKTSSTSDFIETVKPEVALIGVGKNNKFGHPNEEVIKNLKKQNIKTYRTDERGEISIVVNKNGKYTIKSK